MMTALIMAVQLFFLLYFVAMNGVYLMLTLLAFRPGRRSILRRSLDDPPHVHPGFEPAISILAPAWNEEATIVASVRSLMQLIYPEYEVIVINDGSKDRTLEELVRAFDLVPIPDASPVPLRTKAVRAVYGAATYPNLRVVDKENGGKSDALNAGINRARYSLFCCMDADSILQRDSLIRLVQPFLDDPATVACGGTIRVANGCEVRGGLLVKAGLPGSFLAALQVVEYLRAFLLGRLGWGPLNAVLVISGAFGLFHKETVMEAGGYRTDTVGEDMELVVRLHRVLRRQGRPYRIVFVPDPVCWTEVPEDLKTLRSQRIRWQRGLAESLTLNRELLFRRGSGASGWLAFPFMLLFELFGPLIELGGYLFMLVCFFVGVLSTSAWIAFLVVAIGFGVLLSVSALLLEELWFHVYPRTRDIVLLFLLAVAENIGYRQLNSLWRLIGLLRWMRGGKAQWGTMARKASWNRAA